MTPSARIAAVIEVLEALEDTAQPADRFLAAWFRQRRYAGSGDRVAVAERVFAILRRRASLAWRMGGHDARCLTLASLLDEHVTPAAIGALFSGQGYGPEPLRPEEHARLAAPPAATAPVAVRGDFPEFLEPDLTGAFGDALLQEMDALARRAPVDLRVNVLKAERQAVLQALRMGGFAAEPTPWSPWGVRLAGGTGLGGLRTHALFRDGLFEFQDEAAQLAALLAGAQPEETGLDIAAGGGGKALALAAAMGNRGRIAAWDFDPRRMRDLPERIGRAGARIIETAAGAEAPAGPFDFVFVDAPCSGSGTWRRQPEQKWRLTPARLGELAAIQDGLLRQAAARLRPGGRLIYATCSILPRENQARVQAFLAQNPHFAVVPADAAWRGVAGGAPPPPGLGDFWTASPYRCGTDGFFAAILRRTG